MAGSPAIGRRRGPFSTLLRRPGLRASSDGFLATKSDRKMLASRCLPTLCLVAFCVRHSRGEMYIGHGCQCVCMCVSVCLSFAEFSHYCTDPDVTSGNARGFPLVVHYWADLQSVHGFRCNIAPNAKCQRVLALCLV